MTRESKNPFSFFRSFIRGFLLVRRVELDGKSEFESGRLGMNKLYGGWEKKGDLLQLNDSINVSPALLHL